MGEQQEAFRQLVEDTYLTCRYVAACGNIDSVDPALNSNFFDSCTDPISEKMIYSQGKAPKEPIELLMNMVNESGGNLNSLKHLTML